MIEHRSIAVCTCSVCGHSWIPVRCASCKSPSWNTPPGETKRERGRPKKELAPAVRSFDKIPEITEEDISAPIESQSPAKDISDIEKVILRKMGHPYLCECPDCGQLRRMLTPKKIDAQSASNRQPKRKPKK